MNLKGKIAVVTGASDGLGKQVSLRLAEKGVSLALIARRKENLLEIKKQIEKCGSSKVNIYPCDIRDNDSLEKCIKEIISDYKHLNILINCAGIWQKLNPIEKITASEIEDVINTNLTGMIKITRLLIPALKKQKEAAIINVSSRSGYKAQAGQAVYSASKFGVAGFTEVLKEDLAESSIRIGCVYQGGVNTGMFKKVGEVIPDEKYQIFIKPEDLADVIIFMLSRPKQIWLHDVRVEY